MYRTSYKRTRRVSRRSSIPRETTVSHSSKPRNAFAKCDTERSAIGSVVTVTDAARIVAQIDAAAREGMQAQ